MPVIVEYLAIESVECFWLLLLQLVGFFGTGASISIYTSLDGANAPNWKYGILNFVKIFDSLFLKKVVKQKGV